MADKILPQRVSGAPSFLARCLPRQGMGPGPVPGLGAAASLCGAVVQWRLLPSFSYAQLLFAGGQELLPISWGSRICALPERRSALSLPPLQFSPGPFLPTVLKARAGVALAAPLSCISCLETSQAALTLVLPAARRPRRCPRPLLSSSHPQHRRDARR